MNFIYVGSARPEYMNKELLKMGSNVNFAGNTLQEALIDGFSSNLKSFKIITSWSISPFPKVKKLLFRRKELNVYGDNKCVYVGVLNLPIINLVSKFLRTRRELKKSLKKDEINKVFIYEVHTPFILAAITLRKKIEHINVIVPDLPQFMSTGGSRIHRFLKYIDQKIINYSLKKIDSYTLLSEPMMERLPKKDNWVLMEGIFKPTNVGKFVKESYKTIMYTGGVQRRRGAELLINAFKMITDSDYRLWIRGNGDMEDEIRELSKIDSRIVYYEPMERVELLKLESKATVMVNPTPPSLEFTRFFFPSKTMEYLASGTPTIMFRLGCMPPEYENHVFYVECESIEALKDKLIEVCEKSNEELGTFGEKAKNFILNEKSPAIQCRKILKLMGC